MRSPGPARHLPRVPRCEPAHPSAPQRPSHRIPRLLHVLLLILLGGTALEAQAAQLVEVSVLDKDYLVVHLSDGHVVHEDGGVRETILRYTPELNTSVAVQTDSWVLTSSEDGNYGISGRNPQSCHRKTKLSGHAQMEWAGSDYRYEYTYEHWIYLRLPSSLQQGMTYTLEITAATNSDTSSTSLTFDVFHCLSEAVHVNLVGYAPEATHKAADLYHWMGSGGGRDYSTFEGNTVYLYDVNSGEAHPAGLVSFWKPSGGDVGGYNLTRSDVWTADFSDFTNAGTYRLVVEGVGCSQDFEIASDVYADPFKVSVRGYFYMRIGEQNPTGISPPPRTPLYVPGVSPASTKVYLTTMQPWHPDWDSFSGGDRWDAPNDWAPYRKSGNPTNPDAWGGHSDAADWDRHPGHVANIYDLLLPFLMTDGAISDDDAGITESGNGIPDILDEARNEVDFWLRLRDGAGYSHGLTNPNSSNELFQAGPTAIAAWASAAGAAMLADAFRVAGLSSLTDQYRDAAVTAYDHASGLADPMLDEGLELDDGRLRGRDLKMMAAAFLYNVTGTTVWEDVVEAESVCSWGPATLKDGGRNQLYGTAAYLITPRTVHYPTLRNSMRTAILDEARSTEADRIDSRPSRRATDQAPAYFRTGQNVQRTIVAHAVADDSSDRDHFRKALMLEADWGLGRNPLNMIQMTTASTPLESKRSVPEAYTSGMDDGVAGVHPGHTPYMNLNDWAPGMTMGRPSALYEKSHPTNVPGSWPLAEAYFPSRWVWAHNEFTPRQTMRGKMALYGYLHGLAGAPPPTNPILTVWTSGTGGGTVTSSPAGIDCGGDCSEGYASGTDVALSAVPAGGSVFAGWSGACSGTGSCTVTMSTARSVTATFRSNDTPPVVIYDDALASGWDNWSWNATIDLAGSSRVQSGTHAVDATLEGWGAFSPALSSGTIDTYGYDALRFWVHGGTGSNKVLRFFSQGDGGESTQVDFTAVADTWTEVTMTLSQLGDPPTINRLNFFNNSASALSMVTFDKIRLEPGADDTLSTDGVANDGGDAGATALTFIVTLTSAPPDAYALTVNNGGSGIGSVIAEPAGISCGSDCSEAYDAGTSVTLTPLAASGSTFAGWDGACTGDGECTVTMDAKQSVTATFGAAATTPGDLRWVGRVDASDPDAVRFAWQGAGFVATMTGPTVSVNLQTSGTSTVYFQPVVDGLPGDRFEVPPGGVQTVTLATGLSAGDHVIELYRETEGMYGVSIFLGFAQGSVTGAPPASGRLVEVVGDSISAGYGNLGVEPHPDWVANPACHWTAENSSWFRTYAAVAGRAKGAEVSTIARSGWGMSRDRGGDTSGVLSAVYENAVGTDDSTAWGFEPDASVVIVNLGINDISSGDPGAAYETAYVDFVQDVRSRYPDAWIFATIGSMLGGSELDTINAHLQSIVDALDDDKVVTFDLGTQDLGSRGETPTGCDWHPNVADNARMAEIIKARLRTHLGW